MPEAMYNILSSESQNNTLIYADDFSSMLNYKFQTFFILPNIIKMHALKHYVHTMTLIETLHAVYIHHLQAATHLMDLLKK